MAKAVRILFVPAGALATGSAAKRTGSDAETWRLGLVDGDDVDVVDAPPAAPPQQSEHPSPAAPPTIAEAARHLYAVLRGHGYQGQGLVLAIPSAWCLAAPIATDGLPKRKALREAMLFRLEEKLPLAAEEIVADFVPGPRQAGSPESPGDLAGAAGADQRLGVAVQVHHLQGLLEALEDHGIAIEVIAPVAILAAQHALSVPPAAADKADADQGSASALPDVLVWFGSDTERGEASSSSAELFRLGRGRPITWSCLDGDVEDLTRLLALQTIQQARPLQLALWGKGPPVVRFLAKLPAVQVLTQRDVPILRAATSAADFILSGRTNAWVNLRRDALGVQDPYRQVRRPLTLTATLLAVLLVLLPGVMLWRAHRYAELTEAHANVERAAFRQAFPGQAVPLGVRSRLESEERRLRGLSGDAAEADASTSALVLLREALSRLPADLRFRLLELRLEGERIYIEGQARSHGDADAIAVALRKGKGFAIDPPRTENLGDKGVAFTLSGSIPPPAAGSPGGLPAKTVNDKDGAVDKAPISKIVGAKP